MGSHFQCTQCIIIVCTKKRVSTAVSISHIWSDLLSFSGSDSMYCEDHYSPEFSYLSTASHNITFFLKLFLPQNRFFHGMTPGLVSVASDPFQPAVKTANWSLATHS